MTSNSPFCPSSLPPLLFLLLPLLLYCPHLSYLLYLQIHFYHLPLQNRSIILMDSYQCLILFQGS